MNKLFNRILVGIVGIPIVLYLIYLGETYFSLFIFFVSVIALYEFHNMFKTKNISRDFIVSIFANFFVISIFANFPNIETYLIFLGLILILSFIIILFSNENSVKSLFTIVFGIIYISFSFGTLILNRNFFVEKQGIYFTFFLFGTIWSFDSFAYFVGKFFGKKKLFERISPKKTWEGEIGGIIGAILFSIFFKIQFLNFLEMSDVIIIAILCSIFGTFGDLFESMLKRNCEIKDSSKLLFGHGGVLDRFDSLIFVSPIVFIYLKFFLNEYKK